VKVPPGRGPPYQPALRFPDLDIRDDFRTSCSEDDRGLPPNRHWPTDTLDRVGGASSTPAPGWLRPWSGRWTGTGAGGPGVSRCG